MSRRLGDRLTDGLFERLSGRDVESRRGQALLISTVDATGRPPALLSYGEVLEWRALLAALGALVAA